MNASTELPVSEPVFLGVEIGGTKLQIVAGRPGASFLAEERCLIRPSLGARGILDQLAARLPSWVSQQQPARIGIGFGGPVDARQGIVLASHQIDGWDQFGLADWCRQLTGVPTVIGNDCDMAALAEARSGAGQGADSMLYVTVGSGIGGGWVENGLLHGEGRPAATEIGHLRPGVDCRAAEQTVESYASGWGMTGRLLKRIDQDPGAAAARQLLAFVDGDANRLSVREIGLAAEQGNQLARQTLSEAIEILGWALAQAVTLGAPQRIVVGGGVSLLGETLFLTPLRQQIDAFVFPALRGSFDLLPAALGEAVVPTGAVWLAAS